MTTPRLYRLPTSTRARRRGLWLALLAGCAADGLLGVTVASSRIAYLAGNAGELGRPLTCAHLAHRLGSRPSWPWPLSPGSSV